MVRKEFTKILYFILLIFLFLNINIRYSYTITNANIIENNEVDFSMLLKNYDNSHSDDFNKYYDDFISKIGKEDITNVNYCWLRMRPNNDKLIIGSSAVVWCGYTMGDDIDKYGYDVIGYGGMPDEKIREWIPHINKKYKKVIIFSGINTLDLCSLFNLNILPPSAFLSIANTILDIMGNILEAGNKVDYVKIIDLPFKPGDDNELYCIRFNMLAQQLNILIDATPNINPITISYPIDDRYSHGYVHYNKQEVWKSILK